MLLAIDLQFPPSWKLLVVLGFLVDADHRVRGLDRRAVLLVSTVALRLHHPHHRFLHQHGILHCSRLTLVHLDLQRSGDDDRQ